jgi:hypothetical protein
MRRLRELPELRVDTCKGDLKLATRRSALNEDALRLRCCKHIEDRLTCMTSNHSHSERSTEKIF